MSWRVSIRAAAETDLREAHEWYERQQAGLEGLLLVSVAEALTRLEQSADRFAVYYRGF